MKESSSTKRRQKRGKRAPQKPKYSLETRKVFVRMEGMGRREMDHAFKAIAVAINFNLGPEYFGNVPCTLEEHGFTIEFSSEAPPVSIARVLKMLRFYVPRISRG